ncbi:hypothetical protein [Halanaeroarchaeum sp. HSR-CO]|uniref:hypothetical protein n=1 Tax=Halanaeroarchaeum sp. HSR-CO TaxID=2866382 RepID=UPI00217D87E7|nr:hypothetical protein [Halanaeroarchaeum sp. HSR-CO]
MIPRLEILFNKQKELEGCYRRFGQQMGGDEIFDQIIDIGWTFIVILVMLMSIGAIVSSPAALEPNNPLYDAWNTVTTLGVAALVLAIPTGIGVLRWSMSGISGGRGR